MSTFDAGAIEAKLTLKKDDFSKSLQEAKADAEKFSGKDATVKVKADNTAANKGLTDTQSRADKLAKTAPTVKVGVSNDSANRQIDDTQAKADKLGNTTATVRVNSEGGEEAGGMLTSLIAGAAAVAPAFAVAGIGVASFAALAVPGITKVVKAQTDLASGSSKAAAEYSALSGGQKTMVAQIGQLETSYKGLSAAVQPEVFKVFNDLLGTADTILPHLAPLAKEGGDAVDYLVRTIGRVATDPQAHQFAQFLGQEIPKDVQAISQLIPPLAHLLEQLLEDINPLSLSTLGFAGHVLTLADGLAKLPTPLLDTVVAATALYKPMTFLKGSADGLTSALKGVEAEGNSGGLKFGWLASAVSGFQKLQATAKAAQDAAAAEKIVAGGQGAIKEFAVAADGTATAVGKLSLAEKGAASIGAVLSSVNPFAWAGAAAIGIRDPGRPRSRRDRQKPE